MAQIPHGGSGYRSGQRYGIKGTTSTTRSFAADTLYVAPFEVRSQQAFDRIGAEVTVAGTGSTVFRLGIWRMANDGFPGELILDAGTINGTSATEQLITISQTLDFGWVWLGAAAQTVTGSPTLRSAANGMAVMVPEPAGATTASGLQCGHRFDSISGAFASLAGVVPGAQTNNAPWITLRAA